MLACLGHNYICLLPLPVMLPWAAMTVPGAERCAGHSRYQFTPTNQKGITSWLSRPPSVTSWKTSFNPS